MPFWAPYLQAEQVMFKKTLTTKAEQARIGVSKMLAGGT